MNSQPNATAITQPQLFKSLRERNERRARIALFLPACPSVREPVFTLRRDRRQRAGR